MYINHKIYCHQQILYVQKKAWHVVVKAYQFWKVLGTMEYLNLSYNFVTISQTILNKNLLKFTWTSKRINAFFKCFANSILIIIPLATLLENSKSDKYYLFDANLRLTPMLILNSMQELYWALVGFFEDRKQKCF